MSETASRSWRTSLFLGLTFLVLLGVGSGVAWFMARKGIRGPLRVLLITPSPAQSPDGLDMAEGRAIGALVQDLLEQRGGFAVTNVTAVPANLDLFRGQARTLLVQLEPRRQGELLALPYRFVWGHQLSNGSA